jgi:hypothetical protein
MILPLVMKTTAIIFWLVKEKNWHYYIFNIWVTHRMIENAYSQSMLSCEIFKIAAIRHRTSLRK